MLGIPRFKEVTILVFKNLIMMYMKTLFIPLMLMIMLNGCNSPDSVNDTGVANAVELFRQTLIEPDRAVFEKLTSETLSYGHSNGLIEDRETCIASMVDGKFKFTSAEISDQTIDITDKTAIVRHTFFAHTDDEGKDPGTVTLKVLQVWFNDNDQWILLARQAVRI